MRYSVEANLSNMKCDLATLNYFRHLTEPRWASDHDQRMSTVLFIPLPIPNGEGEHETIVTPPPPPPVAPAISDRFRVVILHPPNSPPKWKFTSPWLVVAELHRLCVSPLLIAAIEICMSCKMSNLRGVMNDLVK